MTQIKSAAFLSYLNLAITNIIGILLTPYTIKMLGNSEYGLYTLIGAFVGYMSILDLGLNNAIIRFVAQYRVEKDKIAEENFLAISLIIYAFIGVLITLFGVLFYFNMDYFFGNSLSIIEMGKAKIMMIILIFNIAISLPGGAFTGICSGYEKFVFTRIISIIKYVLRSFLLIAVLFYHGDSVSVVILDTIMNLLFIIASIYYVFYNLKVTIKLHQFKWYLIKVIFNYSFWIFVFALVYQFQWRTGQVVLGSNSNTTIVAIYGVGVMLGIYFTSFGNVINGLLLPKAVQSIHQGLSNEVLTEQMIKVGRLSLILLLYVFGAFALTGRTFIYLWVGKTYHDAWLIALLIMAVYIVPISQGFGHAILEAKKLLKFKAITFLGFSILGTILGAFLSKKQGAIGMISGLVFALFLLQNVMNFYYHKKGGLNMIQFFKKTYVLITLPFIAVLFLCNYINSFFANRWSFFILENGIYTLLFSIVIYKLFMNLEERVYVKKIFIKR